MEKIAVYGSGTIGACQATLVIGHGLPCTVIGHSEKGMERCRKAVAQNWDDLIAEGLATEANKEAALALLHVTNNPAALAEHTFIFEAVTEGADEKRAVYEAAAKYASADAIVASCSSSMDAEVLAGLSPRPEHLPAVFQIPVHPSPHAQSDLDGIMKVQKLLFRRRGDGRDLHQKRGKIFRKPVFPIRHRKRRSGIFHIFQSPNGFSRSHFTKEKQKMQHHA